LIKIAFHIRLPEDLDKALAEYAHRNDMSKNQAVKKAIREMLKDSCRNSQEQERKTG